MHAWLHRLTFGLLALTILLLAGCETVEYDPYPPPRHAGPPPGHPSGVPWRDPYGHRHPGPHGTARVSGTLHLPPGGVPYPATAMVRITDLNRGGEVLAERNLGHVNAAVIPFEVFLEPRRIRQSHVYNLEAFVQRRGRTVLSTTGQVHVITHDNPVEGIGLVLARVGGGGHGYRPGGGHDSHPIDDNGRPTGGHGNHQGGGGHRPPIVGGHQPPPVSPPPVSRPPLVLPRNLTGTVRSAKTVRLQGASRLVIELRNAAGVVISSAEYSQGQTPLSFSLPVPGRQIDRHGRYTVSARLVTPRRTLMTTTEMPVLTNRHPTSGVNLVLY